MSTSPDAAQNAANGVSTPQSTQRRFLAGLIGLFAASIVLLYLLKTIFIVAHWPELTAAGGREIAKALLIGLRFSAAVSAMLLAPVLVFWYLLAVVPRRPVRLLLAIYVGAAAFLIPFVVVSDFVYFQESGKHFTYEATAYLGVSAWPMISGAFSMHPWSLSIALASCFACGLIGFFFGGRLTRRCSPQDGRPRPKWLVSAPIIAALLVICIRGGLQGFILTIGDAVVSANPYINALCLDPVYAVLRTALSPELSFHFYTEEQNVRTVRRLLKCDAQPPVSSNGTGVVSDPPGQAASPSNSLADELKPPATPRYPLLHESPGTAQGNRMNVVIFFLESWSGKDIGCLGGVAHVTPFFDELATQGLLFRNAYANGIRTAEGAFSILCSFPNQPVQPIMNRFSVLQNRWRSLPQILDEAGYENMFIHGRDLDFDHMANFLRTIRFHRIIDRHDFPLAATLANDSWPGAHDEDVVRRADEEFSRIKDHPFFGMIYTMNTHPPFAVPPGFPLVRTPDSDSNLFLNSLNYTDHALKVFFDLAKTRDYYRNTIFVLVADHARTRGVFTIGTQHHIPILFFSPGHIAPKSTWLVASQLDILPTLLGMLQLKTRHASWGAGSDDPRRGRRFRILHGRHRGPLADSAIPGQ